jgi:2-keto-4-pentenoate hydratase/2-oxohepta-3-ene-1,7-dioic acid hydratase in catechol pathway
MVFGGKVYETDGASAVAVFEAEAVRPLAPIAAAPSLRIFRNDFQPLPQPEGQEPFYFYGNPTALSGPSQIIPFPEFATRVAVIPFVAAIIVSTGYRVEVEQAEDMVLGYCPMCLLALPELENSERRLGGFGRSIDIGGAIGPVLTTPDELDDYLVDQEFGRSYGLTAVARINMVDEARGNLEHLALTFGEAISAASRSTPVREGDIFALGPIVDLDTPLMLDPGDDFQLSIENLGTLSLKLSEEGV